MAPSKHLVLVCGFARSGKDTFAKGILAKAPDAIRFAYADKLKTALEVAAEKVGIQVDYSNDSQKALDRPLFVEFGKAMRRRNKQVFARLLENAIINLRSEQSIVVTDWRYLNEYELAKEASDKWAVKLHTVHIVRHGWKAANEEEEMNLNEILANVPMDETIFATSGDEEAVVVAGIRTAKLWDL
jgi:hypothetical protein